MRNPLGVLAACCLAVVMTTSSDAQAATGIVDAELLGVPVNIIGENTGMAGNKRGQYVYFLD